MDYMQHVGWRVCLDPLQVRTDSRQWLDAYSWKRALVTNGSKARLAWQAVRYIRPLAISRL